MIRLILFTGVDLQGGYIFLDTLPVCSTSWTDENSMVVCRQMGLSNGTLSTESKPSKAKYHSYTFDCNGLEKNLLACPVIESKCKGYQAKVECGGKMAHDLL